MIRFEVTCINKSNRPNPHEHITHIGGIDTNGTVWKHTQQGAIFRIENGSVSYFVNKDGKSVDVIVVEDDTGNKYIKTAPDNSNSNNLLNLPECPPSKDNTL